MFINIDQDNFTQDFFKHFFRLGFTECDLITLRDFFSGKDVKIDDELVRACTSIIQGLFCTYILTEVIDLNRFF